MNLNRDREEEQKQVTQMSTEDAPRSDSDELQSLKSRIEELVAENQDYNKMVALINTHTKFLLVKLQMDKYSELQSQSFQYHIERDEMEESHKVRVGQLESELRRCKIELTEKEAEKEALLLSKEAQLADLQDHSSSAGLHSQEGLEQECAALRARLAEEEQRAGAALVLASDESSRLQNMLSAKEDEIATVKSQMESLVLEHSSKQEDLVAQLAGKSKIYEDQIQESKARIAELEQECHVLRGELESANELDLSNMYERQLKKARQENEHWQTRAREAEEHSQQVQGRAVEAEKQLHGTNEELSTLKCALNELEEQKLAAMREAQQLTQMLESQQQASNDEIQRTRVELQAAVEQSDLLRIESDRIKEQLDASLGEIQSYQCTVRKLEEEVQRYHEEANETTRLRQESNQRISELARENESLKEEMAATKRALLELENSMDQLQRDAQGSGNQEQINQMQLKLNSASSELVTLQSNLDATLLRLENTERLLKDSENGSLFLQSENQSLIDARIHK